MVSLGDVMEGGVEGQNYFGRGSVLGVLELDFSSGEEEALGQDVFQEGPPLKLVLELLRFELQLSNEQMDDVDDPHHGLGGLRFFEEFQGIKDIQDEFLDLGHGHLYVLDVDIEKAQDSHLIFSGHWVDDFHSLLGLIPLEKLYVLNWLQLLEVLEEDCWVCLEAENDLDYLHIEENLVFFEQLLQLEQFQMTHPVVEQGLDESNRELMEQGTEHVDYVLGGPKVLFLWFSGYFLEVVDFGEDVSLVQELDVLPRIDQSQGNGFEISKHVLDCLWIGDEVHGLGHGGFLLDSPRMGEVNERLIKALGLGYRLGLAIVEEVGQTTLQSLNQSS